MNITTQKLYEALKELHGACSGRVEFMGSRRLDAARAAITAYESQQPESVEIADFDLHIIECAAHNLPMMADKIDCQDATHPCDNCGPMCPETGAIECWKSERGECPHADAAELRDLAELLRKFPRSKRYGTAPDHANHIDSFGATTA